MSTLSAAPPLSRTTLNKLSNFYSPLFYTPKQFTAALTQYYDSPQHLARKLTSLPLKTSSTPPLTTFQLHDIFFELYQLDGQLSPPTGTSSSPALLRQNAIDVLQTLQISAQVPGLIPAPTQQQQQQEQQQEQQTKQPQAQSQSQPLPAIVPLEQHRRIDGGYEIDISKWERRGNYGFFLDHHQKWVNICCDVPVGDSKADAKDKEQSYFIRTLYAVVRAANEVKEFRYRTINDTDTNLDNHRIINWDQINIISPIKPPNSDNFITLLFKYHPDFNTFYKSVVEQVNNVNPNDDPYQAEIDLEHSGKNDVLLLSSTPFLSFTSLTHSSFKAPRENCAFPLITIGKHDLRNNRFSVPCNVYFGHHFMDGAHVSQFLQLVETYLQFPDGIIKAKL